MDSNFNLVSVSVELCAYVCCSFGYQSVSHGPLSVSKAGGLVEPLAPPTHIDTVWSFLYLLHGHYDSGLKPWAW